ncbi:MAG: c-type cytochrome [Sulfurovum sp.]|nr:c-type cytochrome [Sulfurovum sp.]
MEEAKAAVGKTGDAVNAATAAAAASLANDAGKEAYAAKCKNCHGLDGKTKALGKSALIGGVDKAALVEMLNAYKAGTRNVADSGMLMKGQVEHMDDATIKALAEYISSLK